jgi:nucleotide-binding universal stress UspA family protein
MDEDPWKGKIIVVGVDGSPASRTALGWALTEAATRQVEIRAVFALPSEAPGYPRQTQETVEFMGRKALGRVLQGWPEACGVGVQLVAERGPVSEVIRHAAEEPDVGLVVVGTRGRSRLAEILFGSVSHTVSHACSKPVVIVPPDALTSCRGRTIVVGVDGSTQADLALQWAAHEAEARDAELEVVMATPPPRRPTMSSGSASVSPDDAANRALQEAIDKLGHTRAKIRVRAVVGEPAQVLVDRAARCGLLVVGSRGRGQTKEALLGSVSHGCAHQSKAAVAIVPTCQVADE